MADDINSDIRDLGKYTVGQWIGYIKGTAATAYASASSYLTKGIVGTAALGYVAGAGATGVGLHDPVRAWAERHNFVTPAPLVVKADVTPPQPVTYTVDLMPVLSAVATLTQSVETKFAQTNAVVLDSRNMLKGELTQAIADVPERAAAATQKAIQPGLAAIAKKLSRPEPPPGKPAETVTK